jgi:hypothetical protein
MVTDEQRRAIAEARETCERVSRLSDRNETEPQRNPGTVSSDRMMRWRADMERQEQAFAEARAKRQRAEDDERNNSDEWMQWVGNEISSAVKQIGAGLGEILSEKLNEIGAALDQRDKRIDKLEREIAQQAVTTARLEVRVLEGEAARDQSRVLDLPNLQLRKVVN